MVLDDLIKMNKVPTLFIGSGISKRYLKNYPDWAGLLKDIAKQIGITEFQFNTLMNQIKNENSQLTNSKINAKIADLLTEKLNNIILNGKPDEIFSIDDQKAISSSSTDSFKYLVAKRFLNYEIKEEMQEELELFKKTVQKIGSIITTNYDNFLEKEVFKSFAPVYKQNQLYFADTYEYECIYKIHGTCEKPDSIIINSKDYDTIDRNQRLFIAKMYNLLMTSPMIFMGYSLSDDDIMDILNKFIECFDSSLLSSISRNIILVAWQKGEKELIESVEYVNWCGKTIPITVIKTDNYGKVYDYLSKIELSISPTEIKKIKKILYKLVQDNRMIKEKIYVVGVDNIDDLDSNKVAVAIGKADVINEIQKNGIIGLSVEELCKRILFRNSVDSNIIIDEWYIKTKYISKQHTIPVFYLAKNYKGDYKGQTKFIANYNYLKTKFDKDIKDFYKSNNNFEKDQILNKTSDEILGFDGYKIIINLFLDKKLSSEELRTLLIKIFNDNPSVLHITNFKKLICLIDY